VRSRGVERIRGRNGTDRYQRVDRRVGDAGVRVREIAGYSRDRKGVGILRVRGGPVRKRQMTRDSGAEEREAVILLRVRKTWCRCTNRQHRYDRKDGA
jgi:hypothetical protein